MKKYFTKIYLTILSVLAMGTTALYAADPNEDIVLITAELAKLDTFIASLKGLFIPILIGLLLTFAGFKLLRRFFGKSV